MLQFLHTSSKRRPDIVVIASTESVLRPHAVQIRSTWQPAWSHADLLSTLVLATIPQDDTAASPLDAALYAYLTGKNTNPGAPMRTYQFTHATAMSGGAWHHGREYQLALKGAPEAILAHCDLTEAEREDIQKATASITSEGHQIVAVAYSIQKTVPFGLGELPKKPILTFAGLVSTGAVLHPNARTAVKNAHNAGISVRMLSGGHLETAYAIGHELGILTSHSQAIDSRSLQHMSPESATRAIEETLVFAEATPERKKDIVTTLKKNHTVTVIDNDSLKLSKS